MAVMAGFGFERRRKLTNRRQQHPASLSYQRGQVLPIAVIFIVAVVMALWVLNDSGEIGIEKIQLQNTADSTAYSTAVLLARNWNYAAYMNRAMVANQAALGQGVGFASWMAGCKRYTGFCAPVADSTVAVAKSLMTSADAELSQLSDAQNNFNVGATAAEIQMSSDVTLANDPDVQQVTYFNYSPPPGGLATVSNTQYTRPTVAQILATNGIRFTQFQNVVIGSEDHFTANRSYNWPFPYSLLHYREYGGSELITGVQSGSYKWEWTAMDTLSHYGLFNTSESVSAYGAAHALNAGAGTTFNYSAYSSNKTMWGNGAWRNPKAAQDAANADKNNNVITVQDGGLRSFLDVQNDQQIDTGSTVLILMKKPDSDLSLQQNWNKIDPNYHVPANINVQADGTLPNHQLTTLAKAEIYFYRPYETSSSHAPDWNRQSLPSWISNAASTQNQSDRYEHGSLYSPFWDARLVDTSSADRQLANQYAGVN